ncbi:MAG: RNA recognition motif domain-containing protein [Planctomycetota bacterium]
MGTRILVDNLSLETSEHELHDHFSGSGAVESVSIVMDHESGRSRGFGYVDMEANSDMEAVVVALHGKELRGRALLVSEEEALAGMPQRSGRPLGDFGGRW